MIVFVLIATGVLWHHYSSVALCKSANGIPLSLGYFAGFACAIDGRVYAIEQVQEMQ